MKVAIPPGLCLAALIYCWWTMMQSTHKSVLDDPKTTVEITVHGPDGSVIPAVGPAHPQPKPK